MDAPDPAAAPSIGLAFPLPPGPDAVRVVAQRIRDEFIRATPHLEPGSVVGATGYDLVRLYELYDRHAFHGHLARRLAETGCGTPALTFSGRLSASAGRTVRITLRDPRATSAPSAPPEPARVAYRIEISVPLVLDAFREGAREVHVGGLVCRDRLDVLQRILEHELIHLLENLHWDASDCSRANFHWFAARLFGHTVAGHGLVTRREIARTEYGVRVGDLVAFDFEGRRVEGRIGSIRRRATVFVEEPCPGGGRHRRKFHVPLALLTAVRGG